MKTLDIRASTPDDLISLWVHFPDMLAAAIRLRDAARAAPGEWRDRPVLEVHYFDGVTVLFVPDCGVALVNERGTYLADSLLVEDTIPVAAAKQWDHRFDEENAAAPAKEAAAKEAAAVQARPTRREKFHRAFVLTRRAIVIFIFIPAVVAWLRDGNIEETLVAAISMAATGILPWMILKGWDEDRPRMQAEMAEYWRRMDEEEARVRRTNLRNHKAYQRYQELKQIRIDQREAAAGTEATAEIEAGSLVPQELQPSAPRPLSRFEQLLAQLAAIDADKRRAELAEFAVRNALDRAERGDKSKVYYS